MAVRFDTSFPARLAGWAFDAYGAALKSMSVERASAMGGALLRTLGPRTPIQSVARTNIRMAFPDLSDREERDLLREQWDNFGRLIGEFPHLMDFSIYGDDTDQPRVDVVGAERLDAIAASGKGAVLISGHFANWEVMAMAIVRRNVPCRVTYRPTNNYFVNQRIVQTRANYGIKLQSAKGKEGGMGLLRALAKGESVALMNDQKYNQGVSVPLFGVPAMTADGPTRLARRFNCPLVPMSVKRLPGARFRVTVHDEIEVDHGDDEDRAIINTVSRINTFVENRIREAPAEWFWVHRRWPREVYKHNRRRDWTPGD